MSSRALPAVPFLLLSSCLLANAVHAAGQGDGSVIELGEQTVVATAQEETKQAPGVSIITAEDIRKRPPVNDLSEIIRTMPGVNLTGNSSSGQRGNNRQAIFAAAPDYQVLLDESRITPEEAAAAGISRGVNDISIDVSGSTSGDDAEDS